MDELPYNYVADSADQQIQKAIWHVIEHVPEAVRTFIKEECTFASLGSVSNRMLMVSAGDYDTRYLLVLDERATPDEQPAHVARAVARAWARYHLFDCQPGREELEKSRSGEPHALPVGFRTSWGWREEEDESAKLLREWDL